MTTNVLFAATAERWDEYEMPIRHELKTVGIDAHLSLDIPAKDVDYIVYAPNSGLRDFAPFTRAKAVLSLWAGVETIVTNKTLTLPLCRMVDPSLTQGMVEWVVGHVLRHHLGMDKHILAKPGEWAPSAPPVAWDRSVTVLGLGELGQACAQALAGLGFNVSGWSRSPKEIEGVACYCGDEGLPDALAQAEIVVLLLPDTPATTNLMNAERLGLMAKGSVVINPGRGPLIDDAALLNALDQGQIGHATLDVFRIEPLPVEHRFWAHPKVTVTPHIASETRARWSAKTIAENIQRGESGKPFLHLVDVDLGY
ncbi:MAG: glyoxylate/hydroxypyruvate reductase A [Paracoccaceae bacterium]